MTTRARERNSFGNEGKSCDAVVTHIEQRTGKTRKLIRRPESDGRGPPVDFRLKVGDQDYAIEHTQIEALQGQIRAGKKFTQLIEPIRSDLSGTLPGPAVYVLQLAMDTDLGVNRAELELIRRDFIAWTQENARSLYERNKDRLGRTPASRFLDFIETKPPGFPQSVRLSVRAARRPSECGTLRAVRISPGNEELEARRADRLREALRRKCPKLQRCKKDGARTVLVLESDDFALTNHGLVGECLSALLPERTDLPDEIYFVETDVDPWTVFRVRLDIECWPLERLVEPVDHYVDDLIDLHEDVTT
ncbi:MAG: hypothetical protein F4X58_10270 [Chloroflexi bacterium]|nr:hypothetical protein [Chloroflexota bacterium]